MALNQMNKLVWIVETMARAKRITFEELNSKWVDNDDLSHGKDLLKRTFHKWRQSIWDTFGLDIRCDDSGDFCYYIANLEDMKSDSIGKWLLNTYSVSNSLAESKSLKDRIILETVPSGQEYLDPIIGAMKQNRCISIRHLNYWRGDIREHKMMPLCVKLFSQRWYVVGRSCNSGGDYIYSLDRILDMSLSDETFEYPEDFSPEEYFEGCFGIIVDKRVEMEHVLLKVTEYKAKYMRALPLHSSQKEVKEMNDGEHCYFRLYVRPTYDFQQELLRHREDIEVLEPRKLRRDMAEIISEMGECYKRKKRRK